ncbi:unnamed protein product [Alopecurus aequalis]
MALAADSVVLDRDEKGNPRALRMFASLVEAESRYCTDADAASLPTKNDLVRGFRGGGAPDPIVRSRDSREAGILIEPSTAHRLVSVAVLVAAKFASAPYAPNSQKVLPMCSRQSILPGEFTALELRFLRAIDYRLFVTNEDFIKFCARLEDGPKPSSRKRKAAAVEEPRRVRALPVVAAS